MLLSGCASSSDDSAVLEPTTSSASPSGSMPDSATPPASESGNVVTKFEVISRLEPLTKAVVAFTDTDYTNSGGSMSSPEVLSKVMANFAAVQRQKELWLDFAGGINYTASGISGLEVAIGNYSEGLDAWQAQQSQVLVNWEKCVSDGGNDLSISTCILNDYPIKDEQKARDAYTTPLKALLSALGVSVQ
jgi:hypothetical protein